LYLDATPEHTQVVAVDRDICGIYWKEELMARAEILRDSIIHVVRALTDEAYNSSSSRVLESGLEMLDALIDNFHADLGWLVEHRKRLEAEHNEKEIPTDDTLQTRHRDDGQVDEGG
jgi:hypothetical protein